MKYVILLICFTTQLTLAQDIEVYKKTLTSFQENYNSKNTEAIFNMYSTDLQKEITKEGVIAFTNGCFDQFGELKKLSYIHTEENVLSYNATFEKSNLEIQLQINEDGKISTIQFHPIEE